VLYYIVLGISIIVFFQNPDDARLFDHLGLLRRTRVDILPASGVDLVKLTPAKKTPELNAAVVFLYIGRLFLEKGIADYIVEAHTARKTHK
jgi:glycosyltransferase involved in cell wall biosynthesis